MALINSFNSDYDGMYSTTEFKGTNPCSEIILPLETKRPTSLERWYNQQINKNNYMNGGITMFNINDEVIIVKSEYQEMNDLIGTVLDIVKKEGGSYVYGVEFKDFQYGHDMDGKCKLGHGWYVTESEIELLHKSNLCRMIVKNEDMLKSLKLGSDIGQNGVEYNIRKNGALTFLTEGTRKVFVYKDGADKALILNCISEDDKIVTLHLMEAFRILPMHTIYNNSLLKYSQEESDVKETEMFPVETPIVDPVIETPVAKIYTSEEELYAELGITKK